MAFEAAKLVKSRGVRLLGAENFANKCGILELGPKKLLKKQSTVLNNPCSFSSPAPRLSRRPGPTNPPESDCLPKSLTFVIVDQLLLKHIF